jgi:hypothetical protein
MSRKNTFLEGERNAGDTTLSFAGLFSRSSICDMKNDYQNNCIVLTSWTLLSLILLGTSITVTESPMERSNKESKGPLGTVCQLGFLRRPVVLLICRSLPVVYCRVLTCVTVWQHTSEPCLIFPLNTPCYRRNSDPRFGRLKHDSLGAIGCVVSSKSS